VNKWYSRRQKHWIWKIDCKNLMNKKRYGNFMITIQFLLTLATYSIFKWPCESKLPYMVKSILWISRELDRLKQFFNHSPVPTIISYFFHFQATVGKWIALYGEEYFVNISRTRLYKELLLQQLKSYCDWLHFHITWLWEGNFIWNYWVDCTHLPFIVICSHRKYCTCHELNPQPHLLGYML